MNSGTLLNSTSIYNEDMMENETTRRVKALELYSHMATGGKVHRTLNYLQHKSRKLLDLESSKSPTCKLSRHYTGLQSVAIDRIKGTEGREGDFDDAFYPLHDRLRSRWLGVASARLTGKELSPVELINLGGVYFVQDGHHRISVSKALGEEYIDAEVIDIDC